MPGERYSNNISARFWLIGNDDTYVGIGRITLLEKIQQLGSINAAAKDMQMSYKKAWRLIEEMNQFFDEPLVVKEQGGKSGGGTQLTEKGKNLVKEFRRIEKGLVAFLQKESSQCSF